MAKSEIGKLFTKVTGLTYDIDAIYDNAKTDEEKTKIATMIAWSIKKGHAFTPGANADYDALIAEFDGDDSDETVTVCESDILQIKTALESNDSSDDSSAEASDNGINI